MIRINARNLLATVQTAVASGSWVVGGDSDPQSAVERLERSLDLGATDDSIRYHYDRLADVACEAAATGDWLTPDADAVDAFARMTQTEQTALPLAA